MAIVNYYVVLGVNPKTSQKEILRAFRAKAKQIHPDVNKSPDATAKMAELNEAKTVLSDPKKRAEHDRKIRVSAPTVGRAGVRHSPSGGGGQAGVRRPPSSGVGRAQQERRQAQPHPQRQGNFGRARQEQATSDLQEAQRRRENRERIDRDNQRKRERAEAQRREDQKRREREERAKAERDQQERLAKEEQERLEREEQAKAELERQERLAQAEQERREREERANAERAKREAQEYQERSRKAEQAMSLGLQFPAMPALERTFVALDLETTGLYVERGDRIIQMGAVKFQGDRVIDTFETFVNPGKDIPDFIQRLTGIRPDQVRCAPHFSAVSYDLESFLEGHPIIGHNISFDLKFLETEGLSLANPSYDTWDLATFLLPRNAEYNLQAFIRQFHLGSPGSWHQALHDADVSRQLFLLLLRRAAELEPGLLAWVQQLARRSNWRAADLLAGLESANGGRGRPALFAATGLQLSSLANKVGQPERRRYDTSLAHLDEAKAAGLMGPDGPFAQAFPHFEQRPQQSEMLAAVAQALYQGQHLMVEGGTGVGKSMAYLLPAALFALSRNQRVVISTNTINLQEQLINKDIPALCAVLESAGVVEPGLLKYALLKGRANYLCLSRWNYLANGDNLTPEEARLLSKTAVWLQDAETAEGDRGDLNLGRDAANWSKMSAGERGRCPNLLNGAGPCFVRSSRERAEQAHIVVVNHALLLSDLMRGGSIIPDYQRVVIDEAHNLEDAATNEFSFAIGKDRLDEEVEAMSRLTRETRLALGVEGLDSAKRQQGERLIGEGEALLPPLRDNWGSLWMATEIFFNAQPGKNEDLRIEPKHRSHRSWADLTLAWEKVDVGLNNLAQTLAALTDFLENNPIPQAKEQAGLALEAGNVQSRLEELKEQLAALIGREEPGQIHWLRRDQGKSEITFHSAPLAVGPILYERLYSKKESVVLTSATLTIGESFDFPRRRLGLPAGESGQLKVGSPFNYKRAARLLTPMDAAAPNHPDYPRDIARTLVDLGKTLSGRTMALFTSHNTLRNVERRVREPLKAAGIELLAQNVDGSAQQIGRRFADNYAAAIPTVLLGTNSFWEGVDFPGILKALVITRLPFPVPTNPIIAARSDLYERNKAFSEYSVPLAVLRFRQGMGRLIRNKGDSGVVVVLDQRIVTQGYGQTFIESIPECDRPPVNLATIGDLAGEWVARDSRRGGRG